MRKAEPPAWINEAIAPLPPIANVDEVCAALRLSRTTVRRLISSGAIRTVRTHEARSARVLIPREAVGAYLGTLEVGASVAPLRIARGK